MLVDTDILSGRDGDDWNRVSIMLGSAELIELVGPHVSPDTLLLRLFHEEIPRVFDAQPIRFGCTCSKAKVADALALYAKDDLTEMVDEAGNVTADCQFCGRHYTVTLQDLEHPSKK